MQVLSFGAKTETWHINFLRALDLFLARSDKILLIWTLSWTFEHLGDVIIDVIHAYIN